MELPDEKIELLDLPSELIPQYALSLNLGQINSLCRVSKKFNELICANEYFWKMKFTHDYGFEPKYTGSWKKLYQNYNSVWTFGSNDHGQLGLGDRQRRLTPTPTQIPYVKAKAVSVGGDHTLLIDLDDNVWSFGHNGFGQLGLGDHQRRSTPTQIPQLKAKAISAGEFHTLLIDLEDNVWSFGRNDGRLGLGDDHLRSTPTLIPQLKAKAVSAGGYHTLLIDLDDNVWSFGYNEDSQLGLGDRQDRSTPTQIPYVKAKAVSVGGSHTLLIDLDDNVWSFGRNSNGQLGLGDQQRRSTPTQIPQPESSTGSREPRGARLPFKAKAISAGGSHTVLIDLEDNVWSFGWNNFGQLGLGDQQDRSTPRLISHPKEDHRSSFSIPQLSFKAKAISAEGAHTVVIDLEDNVWSFGWNNFGQLGLGDRRNRSTPTLIPGLKANAVSAGDSNTLLIATLITS